MQCLNELYKLKEQHLGKNDTWQQALESMTACVAPFAPHIADELWQQLGHSSSINHDSWPRHDEQYLVSDTITVVVQVNGKVRANIEVPADASEEAIVDAAKADSKVQAHLQQKEVRKTIYVPQKLVNFVV
jgi:leucyl-tRNA synthetase